MNKKFSWKVPECHSGTLVLKSSTEVGGTFIRNLTCKTRTVELCDSSKAVLGKYRWWIKKGNTNKKEMGNVQVGWTKLEI